MRRLFIRRSPAFEPGIALAIDWSARFAEKEATPEVWRETLLPALERIARAIRQHAPGREVEAYGLPTLPAAAALGCAFLSTSGLAASWRQIAPGREPQVWSLSQPRNDSGFKPRITSKEPTARDIAVLVSIADNSEPVFAAYQKSLPPIRAQVHVMRDGTYPHLIGTPGEATDVALAVQEGMRTARREYGNIGTAHLFMAVPAGVAMLIGQLLNTFGAVQTYEHVAVDGRPVPARRAFASQCLRLPISIVFVRSPLFSTNTRNWPDRKFIFLRSLTSGALLRVRHTEQVASFG